MSESQEPTSDTALDANTAQGELTLTPKERQTLKGRAHKLNPVVLLGNAGLSEPVLKEIDRALQAHELIKIRVPNDDEAERHRISIEIASRLGAARVQSIGKVLVLYRPAPESEQSTAAHVHSGNGTHYNAPGRSNRPQFSPRSAVMRKAGRSR